MFLGLRRAKTYHVLAFPAGEGADQRMRREADEDYATPPLPSDRRPPNPNLPSVANFPLTSLWFRAILLMTIEIPCMKATIQPDPT